MTSKTKKISKNEKYLNAVFSLIKKRDNFVITTKSNRFNDTELRLIGEVLMEKAQGRRLISTQLAKRLGITRSAISQVVKRLEADGVVRRIPDEVDRKIAFVEVVEENLDAYRLDIKACSQLIGDAVETYGAEKFKLMCDMVGEFIDCMQAAKGVAQ